MIQFEQKSLKTESRSTGVEKGVLSSKKYRWRPSAEFVLTRALRGDIRVILTVLGLSFWGRLVWVLVPSSRNFKLKGLPKFFDYFFPRVIRNSFSWGTLRISLFTASDAVCVLSEQ